MVFPLEEADDLNPIIIINILPELGYCFNTKARAPLKLVFETVRFNEAKERKEQFLRRNQRLVESRLKDKEKGHFRKIRNRVQEKKKMSPSKVILDKEIG